ncbi:MAG: NADP-dependent malic enzyme [Canidatus Methanoxibalbensis ujae]|nr:NADP-dependent malic enzyme [Candidatus Methanoxibalbensis ujae]
MEEQEEREEEREEESEGGGEEKGMKEASVLDLHRRYEGKIEVALKVPVRSHEDFAVWYTPGVAAVARRIAERKDAVFELTNRGNTVAIVTDGTRVLGLGNVGAEAALPVMEGKALLFKYLGGVDAFPLCLATSDADSLVNAVKWLSPSFGGVNLEDIEKPKCYDVLERLQQELSIPVWHDDQQGTALVILAGLLNALKVVGKDIATIKIALIGAGAANVNVANFLHIAGARYENMLVVDSRGILHANRDDVRTGGDRKKWELCMLTNPGCTEGGIKEALRGADVCIALSKPGPGVIKKEWVAGMAEDAIVFACANPVPEIMPWEAKEGGARIVATGRSDFENQLNNALGFPAVFRGALDVRARMITDEMCISAAYAIAEYAEEQGLSEERIISGIDEEEMYVREAVAVGVAAMRGGVARLHISVEELEERVRERIRRGREAVIR